MKSLRKVLGHKPTDAPAATPASGESTDSPSKAASVQEKHSPARLSGENRDTDEMDTAAAQAAEPREDKLEDGVQEEKSSEEENVEYLTGLPLLIVVAGLSLAVFLVSLVSVPVSQYQLRWRYSLLQLTSTRPTARTTQSSRLPSRGSQTISRR